MPRDSKKDPFRLADRKLRKLDSKLARIIDSVGPVRIELDSRETVYQSLFKSILYQQLNGKAAATILGRVKDLYPRRKFPRADEFLKTPSESIRKAGVSRAKLLALEDLSRRQLDGLIPSRSKLVAMDDEQIIELLSQTRGIGRWTVHMFLIFTLGRTDVLPDGDYGVRKGFSLVFGGNELPAPRDLLEYGERWRPLRTAAAWYLWRALELPLSKTKKSAQRLQR